MPPNHLQNDSLLKTGRLLTSFLMILLAIGFVALIISIPVIYYFQADLAETLRESAQDKLPMVLATITGLMLWGMALFAAGYVFLMLLRRIIDTVGNGDPFIPENASRLTMMGWITLLTQLAILPVKKLIEYLATHFPPDSLELEVDFSLTGILLALVLFILARVFRHGSDMRDDLEGTV
ncbi:MAG: DUF2975 domain-containing protein [Pseudomonadota bacterium]